MHLLKQMLAQINAGKSPATPANEAGRVNQQIALGRGAKNAAICCLAPGAGGNALVRDGKKGDRLSLGMATKTKLSLAAESLVLLVAAWLVLKLMPYRIISGFLRRPSKVMMPETDQISLAPRVAWAVNAASRRLPWNVVCFPRAIAAHLMLRRRGADSRLHYGLSSRGRSLEAHAWVTCGDRPVVGHREAGGFVLIKTYFAKPGGARMV